MSKVFLIIVILSDLVLYPWMLFLAKSIFWEYKNRLGWQVSVRGKRSSFFVRIVSDEGKNRFITSAPVRFDDFRFKDHYRQKRR